MLKVFTRKLFPIVVLVSALNDAPALSQSITVAPDGTGTLIHHNGNTYQIDGGSLSGDGANLFHSFQEFGLSANEIADFLATPQLQNILGRVTGGNASIIDGLIQVTGGTPNLYLMNPTGIVFGSNASLNVPASFAATTADRIGFGNGQWFNAAGPNQFSKLTGNPNQFAFSAVQPGSLVNAGNLVVPAGHNLMLLGGNVVNTGSLSAPSGNITVAAVPGESLVRLSQAGMLLNLEIEPLAATGDQVSGTENSTSNPPSTQNSTLKTQNSLSLPELLTQANAHHATGITVAADGTLRLTGSNLAIPAAPNTTIISGSLDVSASPSSSPSPSSPPSLSSPQPAGSINLLGNQIGLIDARLDASSPNGGGNVRVGGDYQGRGPMATAARVFVDADSTIQVDALDQGDGGRVILWADEATEFYGHISARGGATSGDGGFVEVSGKQDLGFRGTVDTQAINGSDGTLLLDPTDITVTDGGVAVGFPGQVLFAAPIPTVITENQLEALSGNTNVLLQATNSITINPLSDGRLQFDSGAGSITFEAGGDFSMDTSDTIRTDGRNLTISAANITAGIIDASENEDAAAGPLTVTGGSVVLTATGSINVSRIDTLAQSTITGGGTGPATAVAGAVVLNAGDTITTGEIKATGLASIVGGAGTAEATSGVVSLTAGGAISGGEIDTSSFSETGNGLTRATSGAIAIESGSNVQFDNIKSVATAVNGSLGNTGTAGTVSIVATGTVQGTGTGTTIDLSGTTSSGTVTIQHDGGPNNVAFTIGDASENGLAGSIDLSTSTGGRNELSSGSFAVQANGGSDTPIDGVTITSVNTAPTLSATTVLTGATPNGSFQFSFSDLGISVTDLNSDNTEIIIVRINSGTLARMNSPLVALSAGDTIAAGDVLVYTPADGASGTINAFVIQASDGVSTSSEIQVTVAPSDEDAIPQEVPLEVADEQEVDYSSTCSLVDGGVGSRDRGYAQEFESYLGISQGSARGSTSGCEALQAASGETGQTPVLVYLGFVGNEEPRDPEGSISTATRARPKSLSSRSRSRHRLSPETWLSASSSSPLSLDPGLYRHTQLPAASTGQADDRLDLVLVTPKGTIYKRIPHATRASVQAAIRRLIRGTTNPVISNSTLYLPPAQQLYQWLISPIEAELEAQGVDNLVFILDSGLRSLPLAVLHDGEQFLIERYSLGLMPSLSLTDTRKRPIDNVQVLAMGAEKFPDNTPLPAVPVELSAITNQLWQGEAFLNKNFTLRKLQQLHESRPFGIIHLATHAKFQPGQASNSYIQFSDRKATLQELRQVLAGSPVDLLVLSACQTALGDPEAELGFAGLAVQSGARAALGSLWQVSDEGTLALMTGFYEQLRQAPTKTEALRQAQLAMLQGKVRVENGQLVTATERFPLPPELAELGDRNLSHPFYWSAFTIVGNPW